MARFESDNGVSRVEFGRLEKRQDFFSITKWNKVIDSIPPMLNHPAGFWEIYCDYEQKDNEGFTETDRIWAAAKELVAGKYFIQTSYREPDSRYDSTVVIRFFIEDYSDLEKVRQSAAELRQRFHYPGVFYLKTRRSNETGKRLFITKYLYCCDGDLYERGYVNNRGFRLLKSNSLAS